MTTETTPLDVAHIAMDAAPDDAALRLKFFERLAEAELILALEDQASGPEVSPVTVEVDGAQLVVAFDREERLAKFMNGSAPYAALPGRQLAQLLAGQGLGLMLNPEAGPSSSVWDAAAMTWLAETLAQGPSEMEARPSALRPPKGVPENLLTALDGKLAQTAGLATVAYLVNAEYGSTGRGALLAFVDAVPGSEDALARAVSEALIFAGLEAGFLDVTFLRDADAMVEKMALVGLRFDLPQLPGMDSATPGSNPGMDPEKPPRLR